ncbi:MAG: DUF1259 domain-containing protein [Methylotenera sp.]|nr:DUF1259 domain-containing protein [Oligoflexia bacterium]
MTSFSFVLPALSLLALTSQSGFCAENKLHPEVIEKLTGVSGKMDAKEPVFKISYPRKDLKVKTAGVTMTPGMGLTAWTAFTPMKGEVMAMGDIVMTEDQVNPVMSVALENGLEVTALHNHFFYDSPKVMFMHIGGMGPEEKIAAAVGKVFATLKSTAQTKPQFEQADLDPSKTTLNPQPVTDVLGHPGELKDGILKVTIGAKTKMMGAEMGNAMGVNTWAAFVGSDEKSLVDGDFAMKENELQGVLKALRTAKINVVAIHNHMTNENPRIIFLHFWGVGSTVELARGLKAALTTQGK